MKQRQKDIAVLLIEIKTAINIKDIAKKVSCSERTVRNDLNAIEKWISVSTESRAELKRKPGVGIYLLAEAEERQNLLKALESYQNQYEQENEQRQYRIQLKLLMNNGALTIDELSEDFNISKTVIRDDLRTIKSQLNAKQLNLKIEPRLGVEVLGKEKQKRDALAQVVSKMKIKNKNEIHLIEFFEESLTRCVNEVLLSVIPDLSLEKDLLFYNNITIHTLFMIERIKSESTVTLSKEEWHLVE